MFTHPATQALLAVAACFALTGCAQPLTEQQKQQRDIANPIRGFATPAEVDGASLTMTTLEYFGGFKTSYAFQEGSVTIARTSAMEGAVAQPPVTHLLSASERELWSDVVNLIVREELWTQGDAKTSGAADGGEVAYEFQVGQRKGAFRLINSSPEHLRVFSTKVGNLTQAVEARLSGTPAKK